MGTLQDTPRGLDPTPPWRQTLALPRASMLAPLRLILLAVATAPLIACWLLALPLMLLVPATESVLQPLLVGTWAKVVLWIMGIRVTVEGEPPRGGFFLVANHLSYLDIPVFLAQLNGRFLAKSEIASWPVLGFLARATGTLFVDRSRKRDLTRVIAEVTALIHRGPGVIVFPEATSTDGAGLHGFKPSLFEVPSRLGLPVSCAALHYANPPGVRPAWESVCWWGDAEFAPHFWEFLKLRRTDATVTFAAEPVQAVGPDGPMDRKALSEGAKAVIEGIFTPSRPSADRP